MRIFVGYGYNPRDAWVTEFVFPIIEAFGSEVVTGEGMYVQEISDGVKSAIRRSNALIGILTKREQLADERWTTHPWVVQEMSFALGANIPVVEIRELGVDQQEGIFGNRQNVSYDEKNRDRFLLEIIRVIGRWHRSRHVKLQIMPENIARQLRPYYSRDGFRCTYRLRIEGETQDRVDTNVVPLVGGLFIEAKNIPMGALIQIEANYQEHRWVSSYEAVDSVAIRLMKE